MKNLTVVIAITIVSASMNATCKKDVSNECASCDQKLSVQSFNNISGTVKKVVEGEPFFDGRKYYILIDAETSLATLFAQNRIKYERMFPCSSSVVYSDSDTGNIVSISGKLSKCTTGKHGLLTNNLITFNIYEP